MEWAGQNGHKPTYTQDNFSPVYASPPGASPSLLPSRPFSSPPFYHLQPIIDLTFFFWNFDAEAFL